MGELSRLDVDAEIRELKALLVHTAEQYHFDFKHPKVLTLSQKLDFLIVQLMQRCTN